MDRSGCKHLSSLAAHTHTPERDVFTDKYNRNYLASPVLINYPCQNIEP